MQYATTNEKWPLDKLLKIRKEEVLPQWPTGKAVENLDECVAYAKESMKRKGTVASKVLSRMKEGKFVWCPQFGRATVEEMLDGMKMWEETTTIVPDGLMIIYSDSYTRKGFFGRAQEAIDRSKKEGRSMINGFPIVCHGLENMRKINDALQTPLLFNFADEDARLQCEIGYASGVTQAGGRSLQEVIAHCKKIPLDEMIKLNQYELRLAAHYEENGVPMAVGAASHMTGYDTPGFAVVNHVFQALLTAGQGLKYQFHTHASLMHLVQDTARFEVCDRLTKEYLKKFGFELAGQWKCIYPFLGAWPQVEHEAVAMITWAAVIGQMAGCHMSFLKCIDEAWATPTAKGMAQSISLVKHLEQIMGKQPLPESDTLALEERMIELEVRAVLDRCFELGDGEIIAAMCKGVDAGVVDTMFTPWIYNKGKVLSCRDHEGAVRYLEHGDIPLPKEVIEYNKEKIARREEKEGKKVDFSTVIKDIKYASRTSGIDVTKGIA
jgi:methylaspartate mutase epsilon subunit